MGGRRARSAPNRCATPGRSRPASGCCPGWSTPTATSAWRARARCPPQRAEEHALADRAAGALLLRDAGSPADTRWMDERDDLPRIIRAGRHIARPKRYLRNYAAEVEPEDLVAEVERQAARGDGWVKLVGDWIDRDIGDLAPLWPVDGGPGRRSTRAHELGCRVTAHVFGEQALAELVEAGHRRHRARHRADRGDDGADGRAPGRPGADDGAAGELRVLRRGPARPGSPRTRSTSGPCTRPGSNASPPPARPACRSTPAPTPAATCRTAWSARRSPPWPRSARRSTPWAPGPGGPGPGWAVRTRWSRARRPIWWPSTPIPRQDLAVLRHPARVILRGVVVG